MEFKKKFHLGAINSINWARILAQIVYYFYSYFSFCRQTRQDPASKPKVRYIVPTGNFGDILAGFYAKKMGLPIEKLVIATNQNDILTRFFETGVYERLQVHATCSPAMDIQISSNFERILWYMVQENEPEEETSRQIQHWMQQLAETGRFDVSPELLKRARNYFSAGRASDAETLQSLQLTFKTTLNSGSAMVIDPHTAVGVHVATKLYPSPLIPTICLVTAHPGKFLNAVMAAIHPDRLNSSLSPMDQERKILEDRDEHSIPIPAVFVGILDKPRRCWLSKATPEDTKNLIMNPGSAHRLH